MWEGNMSMDTSNAGGYLTEPNDVPGIKPSKEVERGQSIMPLLVLQILNCPDDEFNLFGFKSQIVTLIGILKKYEVQSTKAIYYIEDNTGIISAVWWLESDSGDTSNVPLVKEGCYYRVYGSLRDNNGVKSLMILKMHSVNSLNEITTHLLEVLRTRLATEKMSKEGNSPKKVTTNNCDTELANTMSFMNETTAMQTDLALKPLQKKVYNIVRPVTSDTGASVKMIMSQFSSNQYAEIRKALEELINEGHIYTTVDDDHYKVTDMM